jgi:hypothetical protein
LKFKPLRKSAVARLRRVKAQASSNCGACEVDELQFQHNATQIRPAVLGVDFLVSPPSTLSEELIEAMSARFFARR